MPLKDAGWTSVEGRDAICKEFYFVDFNQVLFFLCFVGSHVTCCMVDMRPDVSVHMSSVYGDVA